MNLSRLISRYQDAKFALRVSARAETGGSLMLAITDEPPHGYLQGSIELHEDTRLPRQPLKKGALKAIENHALQSGVLELPDEEAGPFVLNGVEYNLLDGVHYEIDIFWAGRQKQVKRIASPEAAFTRLFNSVLELALPDSAMIQRALQLACTSFK